MNDWMIPELTWDDSYQPDRGKVLGPEDLAQIEKFYRYLDSDGDGITYRTYPGADSKGAYFVRGSGHNRYGAYTEDETDYQDVIDRLLVKWQTGRDLVPAPVLRQAGVRSKMGIIAFGSSDGAVIEATDRLASEGIHADYLRLRAFPFPDSVSEFIESHDTIFVVEQNRDAQMRSLLTLETGADPSRLIPLLHYNGMPLPSDAIVESVQAHIKKEAAA
jgi:2-oxoglutarate ferredoxin oxidoreductase subunit alpha